MSSDKESIERAPPPVPEKYKHMYGSNEEQNVKLLEKQGSENSNFEMENPTPVKSGPKPPSAPRPTSTRFAFLTHKPHRSSSREKKKGPKPPSAPRPKSIGFGLAFLTHKPEQPSILPKSKGVQSSNPLFKGRMAAFNKMHESKLHNRIILAAFAVSMLWATSLGVVKALVEDTFLRRPAMSQIGEEVNVLFQKADTERQGFASCTADLLFACEEDYNTLHQVQLDLVNQSQLENEERIANLTIVRADAKQLLNDTLQELTDLANNQGLVLDTFFIDDTENTCPRVKNWITGQTSAAKAQNKLDKFNSETDDKVNFLVDLMDERARYDAEYLANKTKSMRDFGEALVNTARVKTAQAYDALNDTLKNFRNCMGIGGGCPSGIGFLDGQSVVFSDLQLSASNFELSLDSAKTAAEAFLSSASAVEGLLSSLKAEIDALQLGPIADTIPSFSTPGTPGALDGISADFDLIGTPGLPGSVPQPPSIDLGVDQYFQDAQASLIAARNAAEAKLDQFANDVDAYWGNFQFDLTSDPPYDPPSLYAEDQVSNWNNSKEATTQTVDDELDTFSSPEDTTEDEFERQSRIFNYLPDSKEDLIALLPNRTFDFYLYDDSIFNTIQQNLITAGDLLLWADICWRILHTMIIINKYWNLSSIGKPPGDVRYGSSVGKKFGQKLTPDQRLARVLTHPFTLALVSFTFLSLMTWAFWYAYSPFFYRYVDGCIQNGPAEIELGLDDGTMIYRNAFATAYQYAASDGDTISSRKVDEVNLIRDADCRVNLESSEEIFDNQLLDYSSIASDYLESVEFNQEIVECLNLSHIDLVYASTLVEKTSDEVYNDPLTPLNPAAVYDCSATAACEAQCPDPSRSSLQSQSHVTACTFEWWIHGSILGWLMIIITFIFLNWFRLEFVAAVVRIWWRRLSPGKFSFLGSCDDKGVKIYPEAMEEEGKSFQELIQEAVDSAIKSWEKWGYIHAVYALLLNLPWIIGLALLSPNLVYDG